MDLSCPPGQSVNDGIVKGEFLGEPYKLKLPGVDAMIELINQKGPGGTCFSNATWAEPFANSLLIRVI